MFNFQWMANNRTFPTLSAAWGQVGFTLSAGKASPGRPTNLEARITNRQKHAIVAEFGSGIYAEGGGAKGLIFPKKSGALIIPVSTKYMRKLKAETISEARKNGQRHPDILTRLKAQMPGVIGFIFRDNMKGMRPIRMVRDSIPTVSDHFETELSAAFTSQGVSYDSLVMAINSSAALWLREIVKRSPVLTSNLKTGWTLSRLAK